MTVVVHLADGSVEAFSPGFIHATCGQFIDSRERCPYCGVRPLIESTERAVPWAREEPDGTLIVYRGTWVANAYPPATWTSHGKA